MSVKKPSIPGWFGRVFGDFLGRLGRLNYFKALILLWLVSWTLGALLYQGRPELMHTINPGTPEEVKKLVFPVAVVPLRLLWAYLDAKRLRSLGLPALLALVVHALFIVDQLLPNFVVPTYAGLAFMLYLACLLLLPPRLRLKAVNRSGKVLTIYGMEKR